MTHDVTYRNRHFGRLSEPSSRSILPLGRVRPVGNGGSSTVASLGANSFFEGDPGTGMFGSATPVELPGSDVHSSARIVVTDGPRVNMFFGCHDSHA